MRSNLILVKSLARQLCSHGGGPLIGVRGVAIENSQCVIISSSADLCGQDGVYSQFKLLPQMGSKLILYPPIIINSSARGPPSSLWVILIVHNQCACMCHFHHQVSPRESAAKRSRDTKRSEELREEIWIYVKLAFHPQPDISTSSCYVALRSRWQRRSL